jgi:HEAT repeat protein
MFSFKRFSILVITAVILISTAAAQSNSGEMSVEQSYLQEPIEIMIIRETARATTRDQKLIALEYIAEAVVDRQSTNDEIRKTLDYLSREGRNSVARENGRVVNNFPDVRRQSAKYLGIMGTEEARKTLIEVCSFENEPMVLQEAIKSLGDIGTNENNETVLHISWVMGRFNSTTPDNLMALAAIDAFEKIARKNNGINAPEVVRTLILITEGPYVSPVKERARQLLAELRTYGK